MTGSMFRRLAAAAAVTVAALAIAAQPGTASAEGDDPTVLLRSGLVGSTPLPAGPALFGSNPGGAPWEIEYGRVRLDKYGNLNVKVTGLVIPTAPFNGTNPVPALSASVVCNGAVVATTATVPFNTKGNARVNTTVTLPSPCLAPAVLVHPNSNTAVYIAANG